MSHLLHPHAARGNALFLILIAVALFAALSYAVTQSGRGSGSVSREQSAIYAAQITQAGAGMQSIVSRMMLMGTTMTGLSFEDADPPYPTAYDHTPAANLEDRVFHPSGGGATYPTPSEAWLDPAFSASPGYGPYGKWLFQDDTCLDGDVGCAINERDVIATLSYVKKEICVAINKGLGIDNPGGNPPVDGGCPGASPYDGTFATNPFYHIGTTGAVGTTQPSGCVAYNTGCSGGTIYYIYVHSLYEQ